MATLKELKWAITGGSSQLSRSLLDLLDEEGVPYIAWSHQVLDVADESSISVIKENSPDLLTNVLLGQMSMRLRSFQIKLLG